MLLVRPLTLIALAYAALGLTSMQLTLAPGYASPLYLPAGIGVAAVLIAGNRALLGVLAGALALSLLQRAGASPSPDTPDWLGFSLPPALAAAAAVQAWVGAQLVRRWVGFPDPMDTPKSIARFMLLAAPASSLIGAALMTLVLTTLGAVPAADTLLNLTTIWVGQSLGVAVATPICLALYAPPREDWDTRRFLIVAPLVIALLVVGVALRELGRHETERLRGVFEREAQVSMSAIAESVRNHQRILDATHAFISAARTVDVERFGVFAQHWFQFS